ncbi:MAG: hypothetical protein ACJAQ3_000997 [Planctomycetota bacterium]
MSLARRVHPQLASFQLASLFARRLTTPAAALLVGAVAFITPDPHAAWIFTLTLLALVTTARAASWPDAWLTGEGDWLGTAAIPRPSLLASAWIGGALGAIALAAVGALAIAARAELGTSSAITGTGTAPRLEPSLLAGPSRSLILMPGETFEQPLPSAQATGSLTGSPIVRRARVRTTATMGGEAPTTFALIEGGTARKRVSVARRTWLEIDLAPDAPSVRVTNVGEGALAVLGPDPVEIWTASSAWLGGHLRLWAHASAWLVALLSLALTLGVVMGPGVATLLALSIWLGAWMLLGQGAAAPEWLPGGPALHRALASIQSGQSPLPPPTSAIAAAAATLAASAAAGSVLLRTWRDEVRG